MEMSSAGSLVFFGMMAAAKVGCRSSCTQDQTLRLTRGKLPEQNCQNEAYNLTFVLQTYTALVPGSPETVHLESNCQEWSPGRGSVRISYVFFRSISKVLHVDLLLVGVQFSRSIYFC